MITREDLIKRAEQRARLEEAKKDPAFASPEKRAFLLDLEKKMIISPPKQEEQPAEEPVSAPASAPAKQEKVVKQPEVVKKPEVVKQPEVAQIAKPLKPKEPIKFTPEDISFLSGKFESQNSPSAVGKDDTGGLSVGTYSFAETKGTIHRFIDFIKDKNPEMFKLLNSVKRKIPNGIYGGFAKTWKSLSTEELAPLEREFAVKEYFEPSKERLSSIGIDLDKRSLPINQMVFSTAIQHGVDGMEKIFKSIKNVNKLSDAALINAIYDERKTKFPSSKPKVRKAVIERLKKEKLELLKSIATKNNYTSKRNKLM